MFWPPLRLSKRYTENKATVANWHGDKLRDDVKQLISAYSYSNFVKFAVSRKFLCWTTPCKTQLLCNPVFFAETFWPLMHFGH